MKESVRSRKNGPKGVQASRQLNIGKEIYKPRQPWQLSLLRYIGLGLYVQFLAFRISSYTDKLRLMGRGVKFGGGWGVGGEEGGTQHRALS